MSNAAESPLPFYCTMERIPGGGMLYSGLINDRRPGPDGLYGPAGQCRAYGIMRVLVRGAPADVLGAEDAAYGAYAPEQAPLGVGEAPSGPSTLLTITVPGVHI